MTEALTGKIRQKNKNTDMKNECLLVAGGKENKIDLKFFHGFENVFVIACDKGYEYCVKQNVPVDFLCGDFDSCSLEIPEEKTIPFGVDVLPSHKDDTDLIYAVRYALKNGFRKISITCAGGGRADHFLSNVQAMVFAKTGGNGEYEIENPVKISLYDDENEIFIIQNESIELRKKENSSLSVLSFSDKSEGVTIRGTEYEVFDVTLSNRFPLGQSNEWRDEICNISVKNGILLIILSKL